MSKLRVPITARDHALGPRDARLTLVEYGDFQCPACGAAHPRLAQLLASLEGELVFVFRHFPLTQVHAHAFLAARAAEAAGRQGRFWEMHDHIFEHQDELGPDAPVLYATRLGLDLTQFQRDLSDETIEDKIHDDFLGGVRSGVPGTPGFFLNGALLAGLPSRAALEQLAVSME